MTEILNAVDEDRQRTSRRDLNIDCHRRSGRGPLRVKQREVVAEVGRNRSRSRSVRRSAPFASSLSRPTDSAPSSLGLYKTRRRWIRASFLVRQRPRSRAGTPSIEAALGGGSTSNLLAQHAADRSNVFAKPLKVSVALNMPVGFLNTRARKSSQFISDFSPCSDVLSPRLVWAAVGHHGPWYMTAFFFLGF